MKILFFALGVLLLFSTACPADEMTELERKIQKKSGDLLEVKKQLQEKEKKVREKRGQKKEVTRSLVRIERSLDRKQRELRQLKKGIQRLVNTIGEHEREIEKLEVLATSLDGLLRSRVRAMYKLHQVGMVRVLFSAEDYGDALRRYKVFDLIIQNDLQLLQAYQQAIEEKEQKRRVLLEEKEALLGKKKGAEAKTREITKAKRKKSSLLAAIKADERSYRMAIAELKEREQDLNSLIQNLRRRAISRKGGSFASLRGQVPLPVQGPVFIAQGRKKGIGIKTREGAEIKAPFNGVIAYASWLDGYGNLMIIDHGDGYHTVLAHASRLLKAEGEEVDMGEVVGLVGSTGSLEGPMLYFEIRHHARAEDILKWVALPSAVSDE